MLNKLLTFLRGTKYLYFWHYIIAEEIKNNIHTNTNTYCCLSDKLLSNTTGINNDTEIIIVNNFIIIIFIIF